jgi:hypothetical protein
MPTVHPLVEQLRFTRGELRRGLKGLSEADAQTRIQAMNSISWMIGHLAWQEQRYWLFRAQGIMLLPEVNQKYAYGAPAAVPTLKEAWAAWRTVVKAADPWLDTLTTEKLQTPLAEGFSNIGTFLRRTTYHYWYHLGEAMAVRQALGQTGLPQFVGNIDSRAPYTPE